MAMAQPPDAVQARIAPYTGQSSLFLFGAVTLILANLLLSPQGWAILAAFVPGLPKQSPSSGSPTSWFGLIGEIVLLGALLLIGSVSEDAGTFALVLLAALWLVFLLNHQALVIGLFSGATSAVWGTTSNNNNPNNTASSGGAGAGGSF
jgi:hypothetical protein